MIEADLGRIITSRKFANITVYVSDLTNQMWAVTVVVDGRMIVHSRSFTYTKSTEDIVWKQCREYYNKVKKCVGKKELDCLDNLEEL